MSVQILVGDVIERLADLADESVHCVITSPPYWGLRDYGVPSSIWGGDAGCPHDWGSDITERATNHTDKRRWQHTRNGRDEEQPTHKRVGWLRAEIPQGRFCELCGAWAGAHGLEPDYRLYVENEVRIFRAVRRVLRSDGTLWLNLGDCYATGAGKVGAHPGGGDQGARWAGYMGAGTRGHRGQHLPHQSGKAEPRIAAMGPMTQPNRMPQVGLKAKDLAGIPWRVALALQDDGWWLRQDIIWSKPNPMPESVTDRCTKAHEYLFLLSKSERYHYDAEAIKERADTEDLRRPYGSPGANALDARENPQGEGKPRKIKVPGGWDTGTGGHGTMHRSGRTVGEYREVGAKGNAKTFRGGGAYTAGQSFDNSASVDRDSHGNEPNIGLSRNKRSVWTIATAPFPGAHFATFPPALVEPCIAAGCPVGGTVMDPFSGSGTVGLVADRMQRGAILLELNPEYAEMARQRIDEDAGALFGNAVIVSNPGAGAEPERISSAASPHSPALRDAADAGGRTGGSIPPTGAIITEAVQ